MLVNSLFLDFLYENGLHVSKDGSTKDVIGLEFNYKTRSYTDEIQHLYKTTRHAIKEYQDAIVKNDCYLINKSINKREKLRQLSEFAVRNKYVYARRSKEELRREYYNDGVEVKYLYHGSDGKVIREEIIHYRMLFRSTGKAKKGSCIFIRDELYDAAHDFLYMGIKLPDKNAPIVEVSAYCPMVASGIVGRVKINPRNILILKDVDRFFSRDVVSIETNEDRHCLARWIDNYELMNELFDGQALIDSSVFPDWANGYVLLRHHFTKMAAFHSNMQEFFRDWCAENNKDYNTYTVKDYWGNDHLLKDIELVTTINATKWIKFNISYDYWCEKVEANGCNFGVVKFSHPSKLGDVQKMSYQMVNSLDEKTMGSVCFETIKYIRSLKDNDEVFLNYLKKNVNFSNDYEVLIALCNWNPDFVRSSYYRERKKIIIFNYVLQVKSGELLQNADNLVIVGSPYAMLLYAATGDESAVDLDNTLMCEDNTIQCYTSRFDDGEYLAGFRSPFNGKFNMSYLHNHYDDRLLKYFNFSDQIVAVNMIGTDFQDRNNGSDQDSDSMYVTNQPDIVAHAEYCYKNYPTIVNNIPKDSNKYNNTMDDFAAIDNALAKSQMDIGLSSNLAQVAQTYAYNFEDKKYDNYVAILSVIAQASIDSAKRRFDIDIADEISLIQEDMDTNTNGFPKFWKIIKRGFNEKNINYNLKCPMNYLADIKMGNAFSKRNTVDFGEFLEPIEFSADVKLCRDVERLIEKYSFNIYDLLKKNYFITGDYSDDEFLLMRSDFDILVNDIRRSSIAKRNYKNLVYYLISRSFILPNKLNINIKEKTITNKNRSVLLRILYEVNPSLFLSCFKKSL